MTAARPFVVVLSLRCQRNLLAAILPEKPRSLSSKLRARGASSAQATLFGRAKKLIRQE
jgi:hypothetical protein